MNATRFPGRITRNTTVLLAAFFIFSAAETVRSQYRNTISGFVFTSDRKPISNVPVELANEVYQVLARTRTDGSGRYLFSGVSSGKFVIRVLPLGTNLEEQSQEIELVSFARPGGATSDSAFKDFYLKQRSVNAYPQAAVRTIYAQEVPADAQRLYEKALGELQGNRADEAIRVLLDALRIFPDYYMALEVLGSEYIKKGNYEYARAVYTKAISVNDRSYIAWYGLGYAAYALKQPVIAVEAATKATVLDQTSFRAFILLGISQRLARDFPRAEQALLQAKKLSSDNSADVHWNLALLYGNNMGKYEEAASELESYIKSAPADAKLDEVRKLIARFREMAAKKATKA